MPPAKISLVEALISSTRIATGTSSGATGWPDRSTRLGFDRKCTSVPRVFMVPRLIGVAVKWPPIPIAMPPTPPGLPRRSMTTPSVSREASIASSKGAAICGSHTAKAISEIVSPPQGSRPSVESSFASRMRCSSLASIGGRLPMRASSPCMASPTRSIVRVEPSGARSPIETESPSSGTRLPPSTAFIS